MVTVVLVFAFMDGPDILWVRVQFFIIGITINANRGEGTTEIWTGTNAAVVALEVLGSPIWFTPTQKLKSEFSNEKVLTP